MNIYALLFIFFSLDVFIFQLKVDTARVEPLTKQLAKELETVKVRF